MAADAEQHSQSLGLTRTPAVTTGKKKRKTERILTYSLPHILTSSIAME